MLLEHVSLQNDLSSFPLILLGIMEGKPKVQIPTVKLGSQGLEVSLFTESKICRLVFSGHWKLALSSFGLQVSRLGFGCRGLSGTYNSPLSHEAGCSVIKEAFERGITFFDTSDIYGDNQDNEIMVGKVLFFLVFVKFESRLLILDEHLN